MVDVAVFGRMGGEALWRGSLPDSVMGVQRRDVVEFGNGLKGVVLERRVRCLEREQQVCLTLTVDEVARVPDPYASLVD